MEYKKLDQKHIEILKENRCSSSDWGRIFVSEGFDPALVEDAVFRDDVKIGEKTRISRAVLRNVHIEDNVTIENAGTIACTGRTSFGNGHEVSVLNEAGGRELKITTRTSSQIAYLTVMYRDKKNLLAKLNDMADSFSDGVSSGMGFIGNNTRVVNCGEIINVHIGPFSVISGASSLKNGTIDSSKESPSVVGAGVIAEAFIFQKGSSVTDGAMISSCLVGEGTRIGKQFSAENSVFFANSEGFHSEVCSVFGGPYSVTHHRSTLLIAVFVSFFNAGSGTNQSNHMYKLGPVHQGILERGCKTGSYSYLLWPSRVGPFTVIMGKHYTNFDTSDFPFSYISEDNGKSVLVPGMNFFTVGTLRDGEKWPSRDRRKSEPKLDLIIFDVLSPFTAQKMIRGMTILSELYKNSDRGRDYVTHNGIRIKRLLLKTCGRYYQLALDKYLGGILIEMIEREKPSCIRDVLKPAGTDEGQWIDVCGLICRKDRIDDLVSRVESGGIAAFDALHDALRGIHDGYRTDEWDWFLAAYKNLTGRELSGETNENLIEFLNKWEKSSLKFLSMVMGDARKEFEGSTKVGFGIDGNTDGDFDAVRGKFEDNDFVKKLNAEMETVGKRHSAAVKLITQK